MHFYELYIHVITCKPIKGILVSFMYIYPVYIINKKMFTQKAFLTQKFEEKQKINFGLILENKNV
jgi:hypothetical protein